MTIKPFIDDRNPVPQFLFHPPEAANGYNRNEDQCMLSSNDDWHVLLEFLREYSNNSNSYRSYCREVERFCLWLINIPGISISEVKRSHWLDYNEFLLKPSPTKLWCGPKKRRFTKDGGINPDWRPFEQRKNKPPVNEPDNKMPYIYGLSPNSAKKSQKTIEALFSFLVENGYLNGNPASSRRKKSQDAHTRQQVEERFLDVDLIDYTIDKLYELQKTTQTNNKTIFPYVRARYIIQLLAGTGLRISESSNHTMGNINCKGDRWVLSVTGKGGKPRTIRYLPDLVAATREFRVEAGLPSSTPLHGENTPLIPRVQGSESITSERIGQILKWAFNFAVRAKLNESDTYKNDKTEAGKSARGDLIRDASILAKASAHWLRHSHATYYLKKTGDLKDTMLRLGHADVGTTMIYQHVVESEMDNSPNTEDS